MKNILCIIVAFAIFNSSLPIHTENSDCASCSMNENAPVVVSTTINEDGFVTKEFNDGVIVTYISEDELIIRDYKHIYDDYFELNKNTKGVFILIAKVIWTTIAACSAHLYVTGHDACRIVLNYLGSSRKVNVQYELTGKFISGKVPGCEPSHSWECNSGYWEYRVSRG